METASESERVSQVEQSGQYTSPLGLISQLKQNEIKLDVIPVLDLVVIALLVSLVFTRFVMLPGVRVDLPTTELRMQYTEHSVAVLTIQNRGMLFFDGSVYTNDSIDRAFLDYIKAADGSSNVLLVKAEAAIDLQRFLDICQMAEAAGFSQVQLAGSKLEEVPDLIPAASDAANAGSGFVPAL
ncbi:MAG: biopolymer transporter ExbD [Coraliomargarita sp.]|nr:biopolymer transporter ExbD [Coraliomargarita sp.]